MSINLFVLLLALLAIIAVAIFKLKKPAVKPIFIDDMTSSDAIKASQEIKMSYEEALEASKQFIYNIIKLVMQKFTPDDMASLISLGKALSMQGMKYQHVVDVEALQYQKFVQARQHDDRNIGRS